MVTKIEIFIEVLILFQSLIFPYFGTTGPPPYWDRVSSFTRFIDHTIGRTLVGKWLVRRGDPYLKTHKIPNRHTTMYLAGIETTIWAGERPQTHALDRAATGIGLRTGRKTLHSVGGRWMDEYGAMVEWYWQGKTEILWKKFPVPLGPTEISHELTCDWILVFVMRSRQMNA